MICRKIYLLVGKKKHYKMIRLKEHYLKIVAPDLLSKLNINNSLELPAIEKIILSTSATFDSVQIRGVVQETNAIKKKSKKITKAESSRLAKGKNNSSNNSLWDNIPYQVKVALSLISGQRPTENPFRITRPGLNVRKNQLASFQTTLRKDQMYIFLDRLITDVLPNISDFKSLQGELALKSTSPWLDDGSKLKWYYKSHFDGHGNFHIGVRSFYSFREIDQNANFNKLNGFNITIVTTAKTDLIGRLLLSGFQLPWNLNK